jgi:outer membrane immunogenic protein
MNKLRKTASIALVAFAVAGPAAAANLPVPAAPSPSPPPPSWTFFYIGGNAGVGWSTESATTSVPGAPNTLITVPFLGSPLWGTGLSGVSEGGATGGGQIGFNWQMSNLVLGFEADLQAHGGATSTSTSFVAPALGGGIVTNQFNSKTPWFGTLRGRLGTTATTYGPSLLIYGTGGLAYGKENVSDLMTVNFPGDPCLRHFRFQPAQQSGATPLAEASNGCLLAPVG